MLSFCIHLNRGNQTGRGRGCTVSQSGCTTLHGAMSLTSKACQLEERVACCSFTIPQSRQHSIALTAVEKSRWSGFCILSGMGAWIRKLAEQNYYFFFGRQNNSHICDVNWMFCCVPTFTL